MARATALLSALAVLVLGLGGGDRQAPLTHYPAAGRAEATVLLVHGLARSGRSMRPLARHLRDQGHHVVVLDYPSTTAPIAELCDRYLEPALARCRTLGDGPVHIVSHSLGGILVRHHQHHHGIPQLGRVVMLAPPNQGSEVVDAIGDWWLFGRINGPAGRQLGTDADSVPRSLPAVAFPCGVITGHRSINWINSGLIPGPDDGKPVTHPLIMRDRRTWRAIDHFLAHGRFDHADAPAIDAFSRAR